MSKPILAHRAVLLQEAVDALAVRADGTYVDATFGRGGHSRAILERLGPAGRLIALDRDPQAIEAARAIRDPRFSIAHAPFSELARVLDSLGVPAVQGVLADLGVSSPQLEDPARGFSFRADGPLDMRMAQAGLSAADVVNSFKPGDLARIFGFLGEERHAGRIARMIEARRDKRPFERTLELADAIETHVGRAPKDKIHPATRVFQALRIFVNDELGELAKALLAAERALKPGGRLAVVTFHSLEDRIVKRFIADRADVATGSRHLPEAQARTATFRKAGGGVTAGDAEVAANPRARSARLRAAIRTEAPPRSSDFSIFGLPKLPGIDRPGER